MRNFILGVIVTLLVLVLAGWRSPPRACCPPTPTRLRLTLERRIANGALDASMERHAPRVTNPIPPTDENLDRRHEGLHHELRRVPRHARQQAQPAREVASTRRLRNLILDPLDDPEWHIYYAVRTGVRYTGMPAWNKALSDQDIWKVTAFLSRIQKLPPRCRITGRTPLASARRATTGRTNTS